MGVGTRIEVPGPGPLPDGWRHLPCDSDGDLSLEDWTCYVPPMPLVEWDIGWEVGNTYHLLGLFIPLVRDNESCVFSVGGLLLAWPEDGFIPQKAAAGGSLNQLLIGIEDAVVRGAILKYRPGEYYDEDEVARRVGFWCWRVWECEVARGRNRWKKLQDRGGDIHPDWTEYNPLEENGECG